MLRKLLKLTAVGIGFVAATAAILLFGGTVLPNLLGDNPAEAQLRRLIPDVDVPDIDIPNRNRRDRDGDIDVNVPNPDVPNPDVPNPDININPGPNPNPQPRPAPPFNAGGPEDGPLPTLPNGTCPKEFPVQQGKACYAAR